MSLLSKLKAVLLNSDAALFDSVVDESRQIQLEKNQYFYNLKISDDPPYTNVVATWPDKKKVDFIVWCIQEIHKNRDGKISYSPAEVWHQKNMVRDAYIGLLLKTKLQIDDDDLEKILGAFATFKKWGHGTIMAWPVGALISQLSRQYKAEPMSQRMVTMLQNLAEEVKGTNDHQQKARTVLSEKIGNAIFASINQGETKPTLFLGEDRFSALANPMVEAFESDKKKIWHKLIEKAQKVSGAKPSTKYLKETKDLIKELGIDNFKKTVNNWLEFLVNLKDHSYQYTQVWNGQTFTYTATEYISSINADALKGFVWMCSHFHDNTTLNNIAKLAERCHKKIPGKGPTSAALGNACLFQLYSSKGLDGIGLLSRLRLRIKQAGTQNIIERYIAEAAEKEGVTTHEIEDMAVEDFGLANGEREYQFDDYKCKIKVTGVAKSELSWLKPDGGPQKSAPVFAKEKFAARLKKVKETQKQIDLTTSAQRDRIDRMFRSDRKISFDNFNKFYFGHPLMNFLCTKIIWVLWQGKESQTVIFLNGEWVTNENKVIELKDQEWVTLWHPANQKVEEIRKWREFITEHQIRQPLKQAFREVYLITEAEVRTKSYSNRMAAHVLKQHQFNSLAKARGWKYNLIGAYDHGMTNITASVILPEFNLRAEYWINELIIDDQHNDTGIWNFVATDQVRFINITTNLPVDLVDVAAVPFSEILRDVDLFVGVASVGNDPLWRDNGGVAAYRDYWTSYSFGDLSEIGKNRKEVLASLLPRLKIAKVAEIKDKFLVIKGKLRTYKIHIGSTNILMDPNDQYLCIVPDRNPRNQAENLFIPFEGDAALSVILSKAFLLAEDDKITDTTITSQINHR